MRKNIYWQIRDGEVALGAAPLVAAVIPITPEIAPDGEKYLDPDRSYARALHMEEAGAAFIEFAPETLIGGQVATGEEEQLHRLIPVFKRLRDQLSIPVVVRTTRALVAERALDHGIAAIHDPSSLTGDIAMAKVIGDTKIGLILGHMRGAPETWPKQGSMQNPILAVAQDLRAAVHRATRVNIDRKRLLLNPGLSLGKRREDNAAILANMEQLTKLEAPLAVYTDAGGHLINQPVANATAANLPADSRADMDTCLVASVLAGAYVIGAFDVARAIALVRSADAIHAAQREIEPEPPPPPQPRRRY